MPFITKLNGQNNVEEGSEDDNILVLLLSFLKMCYKKRRKKSAGLCNYKKDVFQFKEDRKKCLCWIDRQRSSCLVAKKSPQ